MGVLVGRSAPDFTAAAVTGSGEIVENYNLAESIKGKKAVIFFYPLDFTFVCPSELIAFDHRMQMQSRGVEVIGVSIDLSFHTMHGATLQSMMAVLARLSTHWLLMLSTTFAMLRR